jgi:inward rectifier potassium channel
LGTNASSYGGRFFTKSGKANIRLTGFPFLESISWYHKMLTLPRWKFLMIILLFYFLVNAFFATLYVLIGVDHLKGLPQHRLGMLLDKRSFLVCKPLQRWATGM